MDKRAQRNSKKQKKKKKNGYKIFALFVLYEFFFGIITTSICTFVWSISKCKIKICWYSNGVYALSMDGYYVFI